jgi:hypothetical protein
MSIVLGSLLAVSLLLGPVPPAPRCARQLPAPIVACLARDFPGQAVVSAQDLSPEDRQLWRKLHGDACPGVASGRFLSPSRDAYAVVLSRKAGKRLYETLVVYELRNGACRKHVLVQDALTTTPSVVYRLAPGRYDDPESGESFTSRLAVIAYAHLESEALLFHWDGRRFVSLPRR